MIPPRLRPFLRDAARRAERRRLPLYLVGGCVRDAMLGRPTQDVDLVVEGDAQELARAAARRWGARAQSFDRFGTVRVILPGGMRVDFARARAETYGHPAALPQVRPAGIMQDLSRRDFSVNAMARVLWPSGPGPLLDPHGGRKDLKEGLLRVLHPASFQDDPTRLFRAARYCARLELRLDTQTRRLSRKAVREGFAALLSRQRIRQELLLVLGEACVGRAMGLLQLWGLFPVLHPRFRWTASAGRPTDALTRLGLCALSMPEPSAADFLRSLHLDRPQAQALLAALKHGGGFSPRAPLPKLALRVLSARFPALPKAALRPLLVDGEDLKKLGLTPGRDFALLLDKASRAQWRGEFLNRSQALAWLRARVEHQGELTAST